MTAMDWGSQLRLFKERLAKRLWALPTVTESEKEIVFKEYLSDLDEFEKKINQILDEHKSKEKVSNDENDLLRSLLGVSEDDLKSKTLILSQEKLALEREKNNLLEEAQELRKRLAELEGENESLRLRLSDFEKKSEEFRLQQLRQRDNDIRYFSENNELLKSQAKDLESRISNLRHLFTQANQSYLTEKQQEITLLQKKLMEDMESTLKRKQELSWSEEEMFAKGVAQRVRSTLVSAQGQLLLTLERLGLLDPKNKSESFWKARLHLLVEGAQELSENFQRVQAQLQDVTSALDDYLHLTNRRELVSGPVSLKELVEREMAELFAERRPTLAVEFLSDDPVPDIPGDLALLRFIIHELLKNALEALVNESGQIIISIKNRSDLGMVQLVVRDTGKGIPEHLAPRLFQPFFSTKEHRQGLSLSRARRYAEFHGGVLEMLQTGKDGTTFQLELPLRKEGSLLLRSLLPESALEKRKAS
ncbi:MAG: Adaptive-response sensory-kinase SasA [Elusimicrobia bacterium]|nr:Adaptive-response sensory-kinase SasA [Elusimicrobiota bacterium]